MSSLPEVLAAYALIMMLAVGMLLLVGAIVTLVHRRVVAWRARRCLPADWWECFERDLHDYVSNGWTSARDRELQD
jgi:hypothetical protein